MKLFTEVVTPDAPFTIELGASVVSIGSCFADVTAKQFQKRRFQTVYNPFGTLYNPITICDSIRRVIEPQIWCDKDLFSYNNHFYPLSHSTTFNSSNIEKCVQQLNETDMSVHKALKKASLLILTLGSAWAYRLKSSDEIVGNCHKLPGNLFSRELISPEKVISNLSDLLTKLKFFNPNCKVIITISPVRHVRDTMIQNSRSKASLLYAVGELCEQHQELYYFPSYEILMDELRDYRFYSESLVQPSTLTEKIIWERFSKAIFSERSQLFFSQYEKIEKALSHRFAPESDTISFFKTVNQQSRNSSKAISRD